LGAPCFCFSLLLLMVMPFPWVLGLLLLLATVAFAGQRGLQECTCNTQDVSGPWEWNDPFSASGSTLPTLQPQTKASAHLHSDAIPLQGREHGRTVVQQADAIYSVNHGDIRVQPAVLCQVALPICTLHTRV
jgi:hypothetical protein